MNVSKWSMSVLLAVACLFIATPVWAAKKMETSTACKKKKWSQKRFSHRLFSGMLKKYVRNGLVNYNGFRKKRRKLDKYLCRLAHTNVKKIRSRKARFAFWINAYNAITIRAILDRLPRSRGGQKSFSVVKKKWNFWKGSKYEVSGKWYTLDQIENGLIRFTNVQLGADSLIGGEGNGGVIYPELHYGRDALVGIALFLSLLVTKGTKVSSLKEDYPKYYMKKLKISLDNSNLIDQVFKKIINKYSKLSPNTEDGVRIDFDNGWVHIRKSNTEPIVRIFSESSSQVDADNIAFKIESEIKGLI